MAIPYVSLQRQTDSCQSGMCVCVREPWGVREGEGAVGEEEGMPHGLPVLPAPYLSRPSVLTNA